MMKIVFSYDFQNYLTYTTMRKLLGCSLVLGWIVLAGCAQKNDYEAVFADATLYSKVADQLTEVITFDIFTPPVASRIYAYAHLAAYEAMAAGSDKYQSLGNQLKDFTPPPVPADGPIHYHFAATLAMLQVGEALTFSRETAAAMKDSVLALAKLHGMPKDMYQNSVSFADTVSKHILNWSKKDNYAETRSAPKYAVPNEEGLWIPTPPGYFPAVEPHWRTIRPLVLDSANQFIAPPPPAFSKEQGSPFYKMAWDVYEAVNKTNQEEESIANFWDCNGFKLNVAGHVMFATKAMTPGGHWMGITGIIARNQQSDFDDTIHAFTKVAFSVMDAFISCWDMKYFYNLVRPETYIRRYIDEHWEPVLQTPPFPDYTSGHAIISTAAATVLTDLYGEQTPFKDTTERAWGWPDREFQSPLQAAKEAGLSRFYGGIHYMDAITASEIQGHKIGELVNTKIRTRK